jgi:hypothetical protein
MDDVLIDEHDVLARVDDRHRVWNGLECRERDGARRAALCGDRLRSGTKRFARVPHAPLRTVRDWSGERTRRCPAASLRRSNVFPWRPAAT